MIKDYIYSIYNNVKVSARNLSVKLDAIRENQDEILKIRDASTKAFKENKALGESINSAVDSINNYSAGDISSINDLGGLKKLVKDLKETQKLAAEAIKKTQEHKKNIEKLAEDANKTVTAVDKSEAGKLAALDKVAKEEQEKYENQVVSDNTIASLDQLEENASRIQAEADKKIKELEMEEKDDDADAQSDEDPQNAVSECPNKCKLTKVEVTDKANRLLSYNVNAKPVPAETDEKGNKKSKPSIPKTMFVIVGNKKAEAGKDYAEHITIKSDGSCKSGSACPTVSFEGAGISEREVSTLSQIKIKSEKVIPEKSWADFLRKIIVPDMNVLAKPQVYNIKAHQCDIEDKVADLKVIAVPPVGWSGSAKISYKMKDDAEKEKIAKENAEKGIDEAKALGDWEFGGKIAAYIDDKDYSYEPPKEFLKGLQEGMNKITPMFSEIDNQYASVKVQWPNIDLSGNVDLIEHPTSHKLNYSGEINLKAAPLIQIDCDVDIKAIILRILAKHEMFSDYMMEILNKVEKGVGGEKVKFSAKIELLLKTSAEISGDLRWHRTKEDGAWQVDSAKSTVGGSMGVELYGAVHIEGRVFFVRAAAGASISGRSADGKEKCKFGIRWAALEGAQNPALQKELYFNGLAIYYTKYAELGTDDTEAGKAAQKVIKQAKMQGGDDLDDSEDVEESDNLFEAGSKDLKSLCTLMNEWTSKNEVSELGKDEL